MLHLSSGIQKAFHDGRVAFLGSDVPWGLVTKLAAVSKGVCEETKGYFKNTIVMKTVKNSNEK